MADHRSASTDHCAMDRITDDAPQQDAHPIGEGLPIPVADPAGVDATVPPAAGALSPVYTNPKLKKKKGQRVFYQRQIAKVRILVNYLASWFAVNGHMLSENKEILYIDGFAGAGQFADEAGSEYPGSPMAALREMLKSNLWTKKALRLKAVLIELDRKKARALQQRVNDFKGSLDAERRDILEITVLEGRFEDKMCEFLNKYDKNNCCGAFAFVDPYGITTSPMSMLRRIVTELPYAEVFFNFIVQGAVRTAPRFPGSVEAILGASIEDWSDDYRQVCAEAVPSYRRRRFFVDLFCNVAQGGVDTKGRKIFAVPFYFDVPSTPYFLVHISAHRKATKLMARAMSKTITADTSRWTLGTGIMMPTFTEKCFGPAVEEEKFATPDHLCKLRGSVLDDFVSTERRGKAACKLIDLYDASWAKGVTCTKADIVHWLKSKGPSSFPFSTVANANFPDTSYDYFTLNRGAQEIRAEKITLTFCQGGAPPDSSQDEAGRLALLFLDEAAANDDPVTGSGILCHLLRHCAYWGLVDPGATTKPCRKKLLESAFSIVADTAAKQNPARTLFIDNKPVRAVTAGKKRKRWPAVKLESTITLVIQQ